MRTPTAGWSPDPSTGSGTWPSSGSPNGFRRTGQTRRIPAAASDIRVNDAGHAGHELPGPGATRVRASMRRASGCSQTLPVTRSAPSSVITAQAGPSPGLPPPHRAHQAESDLATRQQEANAPESRSRQAELPGEADPPHAKPTARKQADYLIVTLSDGLCPAQRAEPPLGAVASSTKALPEMGQIEHYDLAVDHVGTPADLHELDLTCRCERVG